MATYYLRPSADISLQHTCSTGSSGYALINEATPDDDSKYIYHEFKGSSSSGTTETTTSTFTVSGTVKSSHIINSATLYIRVKRTGNSSSDSTMSGSVGTSSISATKLTSTYANYSCSVALSNLTRSGNTVTATLSATTAIKCYKNDTGGGRITQAYIELDVTEVTELGVYLKENSTWKSCVAIYKKISGSWVKQTTAPTGYNKILRRHNPWTFGKELQRGASFVDNSDYIISDYISVTPGVELIVQGQGSNGTNTMWLDYKSDKSYNDYWGTAGTTITTIGGKVVYSRTLPASSMANIYYVRVNALKQAWNYIKITQNGVVLFDGSQYPYN